VFSRLIASSSFVILFASAAVAAEKSPLHERIDALVAATANGPLSPASDDAEFVRRIYLDLAGRIPSVEQATTFQEGKKANKRSVLIDSLIGTDEYAEQWANLFHIMLMERRGEDDQWRQFLVESFKSNKPWRQMAKEIVSPEPADVAARGAAYFYTKRLEKYGQNPVDHPGLVRDIGRMFLGVDVQCAECHDHLFVSDYVQTDYQGLYAFVGTTFIRRDTEFPAIGEKPLQEKIEFQSVFDTESMSTGPRLLGGTEVSIPEFKSGEEYITPPDRKKKTPGVLKFSPLKVLGEEMTGKDNQYFARNIANRLWWSLLGRGIVEPLDLHHQDNLPSHPKLLDLLAAEIVEHDYDMGFLIREIALSQTYQRSSLLPAAKGNGKADENGEPKLESFRTAIERPLSARQLLNSVVVALEIKGVSPAELDEPAEAGDAKKESDDEAGEVESYRDLLKRFRDALANPPREPELKVNATVKSALFIMHDPVVLSWLKPHGGNLTERLAKMGSVEKAANELYLSILSRPASAEEIADVQAHLQSLKEQADVAWTQLAWSLLASTEFYVNH
jgi:hypothetical protein